MKALNIFLSAAAFLIGTAGFSQKTITKIALDSIVIPRNSKMIYFYNKSGKNTQQITYDWLFGYTEWHMKTKYEYTYDDKENLTEYIYYIWNGSDWNEYIKFEYTYNDEGSIKELIRYRWCTYCIEWELQRKYEYMYDNRGNITLETFHEWDGTNWQASGYYECEYAYNDKKNIIEKTCYSENNMGWEDTSHCKYEYMYDGKGNITECIIYGWYGEKNEFIEEYKYNYRHDTIGNVIEYIWSYWEKRDNKWVEFGKHEYEHNLFYSKTDLIIPNFVSYTYNILHISHPYINMLTMDKKYEWNYDLYKITIKDSTIYYWSEKEIGDNEDDIKISDIIGSNPSISIYPNPTTGQLIIDNGVLTIKNIEVFDVVGQVAGAYRIRQENNETTIDISHLANGLYFLKVDGKVFKVIKE